MSSKVSKYSTAVLTSLITFMIFQWKETDGSQLMDSKLKCLFVMPENNGGVTANGAASNDHAKQDYHHSVSSSVPVPGKPASSSPKVGK